MIDQSQQQELLAQFEKIVAAGNEDEAMKFVIDHMKEFPEEMQRELAVAIFSDALEENIEAQAAIKQAKEKAVAAIQVFEEEEKKIQDAGK